MFSVSQSAAKEGADLAGRKGPSSSIILNPTSWIGLALSKVGVRVEDNGGDGASLLEVEGLLAGGLISSVPLPEPNNPTDVSVNNLRAGLRPVPSSSESRFNGVACSISRMRRLGVFGEVGSSPRGVGGPRLVGRETGEGGILVSGAGKKSAKGSSARGPLDRGRNIEGRCSRW